MYHSKTKTTRLHDLLIRVPLDTREAIIKLSEATQIPAQKIRRIKRGDTKTLSLTDATLIARWFNQYFPCNAEDLITKNLLIAKAHKLKFVR
ncbi:MAG: hypothetical protein MUE96_10980 [Bacteroidia bacterium]|jgi:hypothetical protein|nr:hypothetical protein [Bacteroidia bacterium]